MDDPFREELAAAIERADALASENAELRDRLDRQSCQSQPDALRQRRDPPPAAAPVTIPPALVQATLEKLDELQLDATSAPAPSTEPRPARSTSVELVLPPLAPLVEAPSTGLDQDVADLRAENAALRLRLGEEGGRLQTATVCMIMTLSAVLGVVVGYLLR